MSSELPQFTADPDLLDALADQLQKIHNGLPDPHSGPQFDNWSVVGHDELARKVEDFYAGWNDGLARIRGAAAAAVNHLRQSAANYRTADSSVAQCISVPPPPPIAGPSVNTGQEPVPHGGRR